jgi:hypothetical protein
MLRKWFLNEQSCTVSIISSRGPFQFSMLTVDSRSLERTEANEPSSSNYDVEIHQKSVDAFNYFGFAPEFQRH